MINLKLGDIKEPFPEKIIEEFREKLFKEANLYPLDYSRLEKRLAEMHSLKRENVVLTAGTDESIELLSRAFNEDILVFTPAYYEFIDAPERNGFRVEKINCFNGKGFELKYKDEDVESRSLVFLCNPNNPFGLLSKKQILGLAEKSGGIVAVDETYIGFAGESVIGEIAKQENLVVMRSFSKSYSLAGMRIAYLAGSKKALEKVKKIKMICNVSTPAVNAALVVLGERDFFQKRIQRIMAKKEALEGFMEKKGFNVIKTHTNNIVLKFADEKEAARFRKFLEKRGFLVNQGNGVSTCGLDGSFIRFNYGKEKDMQEFKKAVAGFN